MLTPPFCFVCNQNIGVHFFQPTSVQAIYDGDGAKNVFALFFGWVPGLILAFVTWFLTRSYRWLKLKTMRQPNA
jgi:hypothetical protein